MSERAWYREPETFIAVAALIVSVSAVVVGLYEASLQRKHDRAEVFPRLSVATITSVNGATISLVNGGIGPAIVEYVAVSVDGKPQKDWGTALTALSGRDPGNNYGNSTVADESVRAGDRFQMVGIPTSAMPANFWNAIKRVSIRICYVSVFDEAWTLRVDSLGASPDVRQPAKSCPTQPVGVGF